MNKILVTYATNSGTTVEVARAIQEEIQKSGLPVDVLPIAEVRDLAAYSAVVLGAPMIMGWHRAALRFLHKNKTALSKIPLAVFVTCMSLTKTPETSLQSVPLCVDENLPKSPIDQNHLTFKERYSRVSNYLRPILQACPRPPVSAGVFGGRLDYGRMQWWATLLVMFFLQAAAGDRRNWSAIRGWASSLPALFNPANSER